MAPVSWLPCLKRDSHNARQFSLLSGTSGSLSLSQPTGSLSYCRTRKSCRDDGILVFLTEQKSVAKMWVCRLSQSQKDVEIGSATKGVFLLYKQILWVSIKSLVTQCSPQRM